VTWYPVFEPLHYKMRQIDKPDGEGALVWALPEDDPF